MADENGSGQVPDQNAAVTAPATAPTPAASSLTETDFDKRVQGARTLADIKALKEEALRPRAVKPPETPPAGTTPAGGPPPDLATPQGDAPAAPGDGGATPALEGAETPAANQGAEDDEVIDDEADGPPAIPTSKSIRLTPAQNDKVGRLTTALMRRNRDWNMEQALLAAKEQLGLNPKPDPEEAPLGNTQQSNLPQTLDEVDQSIEQLEAEVEAAQVGLRFEEAAKKAKEIRQLDRHRLKLERDAERAEGDKVTSYQTAFAASEAKTLALYPFAGDPASAGAKRMLEIDADLKANGDPLYNSPDRPLKLAQMAAAELNIAPLRKGGITTPKPPAGAAPVATPPKKQVLPGGGSHTTPVSANTTPADVARVSSIKTLADLRAERKRLGLPD